MNKFLIYSLYFYRMFQKIINLFKIIYYYTLHTLVWGLLAPFLSCSDVYQAGSLDALRIIGLDIGIMGKCRHDLFHFKGIVLSSHKGFTDFYTLSSLAFPTCVSRFSIFFFYGLILY